MAAKKTPTAILVVGRDEGLIKLIADALSAGGYAITGADSGRSAVANLRKRRADLMLLDLHLSDMSGAILLDRLKQEGLAVPFVVVTGGSDEKAAVEMMKQGALDYVTKDSSILDLLPPVVKSALDIVEKQKMLAAVQVQRRRLEKEVLDSSDREQQRIGADLHDGLGQQLTAIELMGVALKAEVEALDPRLGQQLDKITNLLRETIAQTRSLARGLAPLNGQPDAFQNGLIDLADQSNSLGRLHCRVDGLSKRPLKDRTAAGHLFRIAQEAVNNAVKHSGASEVVLRWKNLPDGFRLEVSDNGKGIPRKAVRGLGLGIMNYRADIIGASLTVASKPGKGTHIVCLLPRRT